MTTSFKKGHYIELQVLQNEDVKVLKHLSWPYITGYASDME